MRLLGEAGYLNSNCKRPASWHLLTPSLPLVPENTGPLAEVLTLNLKDFIPLVEPLRILLETTSVVTFAGNLSGKIGFKNVELSLSPCI